MAEARSPQTSVADRLCAATIEIADSLANLPAPTSWSDATLARGTAGAALLHVHHWRAGAGSESTAAGALDDAMTAVAELEMAPVLLNGFVGTAWVAETARRHGLLSADEDPSSEVDDALLAFLNRGAPGMAIELKGGLVGSGLYGLERAATPTGRAIAERVLARLEELAERGPTGTTWISHRPRQEAQQTGVSGYWSIGLSAGVLGVIGLLTRAVAEGIATTTAGTLLGEAVDWVLAQKEAGRSPSGYATFLFPGGRFVAEGRLTWCNGDLGIASTLLRAARQLGRADWEREALRVARLSAARAREDTEVVDAGLCHGAAGAAHMFGRLYRATGEEAFAQARDRWLDEALLLRRPGERFAGFPRRQLEPTEAWIADPGLLDGAAGVGLAFLAASGLEPPEWDRLLLMDLPEVG